MDDRLDVGDGPRAGPPRADLIGDRSAALSLPEEYSPRETHGTVFELIVTASPREVIYRVLR
jgi:hypothetical protein